MIIKKNLVPPTKYSLKCPHAMTSVGLCIHNTANDASAKNEISYMVGNDNQTSFHFAVDDIEVWQGLPLDRNGWHAGDGASGAGNRKHIGIEICYSKSGGNKFTKAENRAVDLIVYLLKDRKWGIAQVKKHQDFSGKYCPHRTLDLGWDRFINKIRNKLGEDMTADEMIIKKTDFERLVTKSTHWDAILTYIPATDLDNAKAVIGGIRGRVTELESKLGTAKAEMENREEQVKRLEDKIANSYKEIKSLTINLNNKITEYDELAVAKGKQYIELQQALTTIETLRQQAQQGEVSITLRDFFNLLWNQKIIIKKG